MPTKEIIRRIKSLRRNRDSDIWDGRTLGGSPHKPLLLLSVLDGIESGWINSPRIKLSQDLIETFFRYWEAIIGRDRNTTIALPFYHMKSEPFWELQYNEGMKPYQSSPSLGGLTQRLACARLDVELFDMINNDKTRRKIIQVLLRTYFSEQVHGHLLDIHSINVGAYDYLHQLEMLTAEPFVKYHTENEEELYSWQKKQKREHGFSLTIRRTYDHQCAICRTRVKTNNGASLVEGAHIIPWSMSKNDDPRNGLALCKTHHWMFDNYLLAVKPNYQIKLSTWLKERAEQIEGTLPWDRKEILLPQNQRFYPNEEALKEHYGLFNNSW